MAIMMRVIATFNALLGRLKAFMDPDRYRPERHYMRGPGPKSLRKSGSERQ
jgi:hypothetical protein